MLPLLSQCSLILPESWFLCRLLDERSSRKHRPGLLHACLNWRGTWNWTPGLSVNPNSLAWEQLWAVEIRILKSMGSPRQHGSWVTEGPPPGPPASVIVSWNRMLGGVFPWCFHGDGDWEGWFSSSIWLDLELHTSLVMFRKREGTPWIIWVRPFYRM